MTTKANFSTGVGSGQTGDFQLSPKGDRPVDAPGPPSNAELHRYFCEPWCPTHSCFADECPKDSYCTDSEHGLHTRDPRTKVKGLKYSRSLNRTKHWYQGVIRLEPWHAADLLVMGILKVQPMSGLAIFIVHVAGLIESGKSWPEAVALAYHRMLDAEEQE